MNEFAIQTQTETIVGATAIAIHAFKRVRLAERELEARRIELEQAFGQGNINMTEVL
jgi:hypothetical protein